MIVNQQNRRESDFLTDLILFYKMASVALHSASDRETHFICPFCKGRAIAQRDKTDNKIQAKCLNCGFGEEEEEEGDL